MLSTAYWAEWTVAVREHVIKVCITSMDTLKFDLPLFFKNNKCNIGLMDIYIAHGGALTLLAKMLAQRMRPHQLSIWVDDVSAPAVLNILRFIGTDLAVRIYGAPASFSCALLRANICSHLDLDTELTLLGREALLQASKLRVLCLSSGRIDPLVRDICERAPSLCYAGAYSCDPPIKVRNGLVPHPGCWTDKSHPWITNNGCFANSIIDRVCTNRLRSICASLQQTYDTRFTFYELGAQSQYYPVNKINLSESAMLLIDPYDESLLEVSSIVKPWRRPNKSGLFHGTSLASGVQIRKDGKLSLDAHGHIYATPNPLYALHPSFAKPTFLDDQTAIQVIVELVETAPSYKQAATVQCCLSDAESIEWVYETSPEVRLVWIAVYARA